jgi:[acyl-carrier-protein] S-malonyltransferase
MEDGFRIVQARAAVMEEAAATAAGAMVAVSGDAAAVEAVCARYGRLWAANYNHPAQTVISGVEASCLAAADELAAAGARVTRLAVSSAFHTPLMAQAAGRFKEIIADIPFAPPDIGFYSNMTGELLIPENFPAYFAAHMTSPVLFTRQMAAAARNGIQACVEFGPKRVAATLAKKNIKAITALNVEDPASLEKTLAALEGLLAAQM